MVRKLRHGEIVLPVQQSRSEEEVLKRRRNLQLGWDGHGGGAEGPRVYCTFLVQEGSAVSARLQRARLEASRSLCKSEPK